MRARLIVVFALAAMLVVPAGTAFASPTPHLSDGCNAANDLYFDGLSVSGGLSGLEFAKGEVLTISADDPHDYGSPRSISLSVNFATVDADTFPGTVAFAFPEGGAYSTVGWIADGGNATWDVSCAAADRGAGKSVSVRSVRPVCGADDDCRVSPRIGLR